jgi:hypothetical protein
MVVVLLVGLLHGLVYVVFVPPWQHYEEPAHFEFSWMILTRRAIPGYGAYDNAIRRELAISMADHGFFRDLGFIPNLYAPASEPIWIGLGQADTAPLFHIAMTVPLALFADADVTTRLYAVRLAALGLYLLLLWVAYLLVRELTPAGHPLRWSVPAGLALLPALTDIMTAFNDDAGAITVFSLFLLAAVRLIRRGPSFWRIVAVLALAGLCAVTKTTVLIALPLALSAILLGLATARRRWLPLAASLLAVAAALGFASAVTWGDALAWYRVSNQGQSTRVEQPDAPWGAHVLRLIAQPGQPPVELKQFLLAKDAEALGGQQATVGAWMWASTPGPAFLPRVGAHPPVTVTVGASPAFFSGVVTIPTDTQRLAVSLLASPAAGQAGARTIYYDGLVLTEGAIPAGHTPTLDDTGAASGIWAGQAFTNRIRNASAERAAPWVRPWAESLFQRAAGAYLSPSALVGAVADYDRNGPLYGLTASRLLESFWARFGWAQITLEPPWYWLALAFTALGVAAGLFRLARAWRRQSGPWKVTLAWLALAMLVSWGTVYLRGLFTVIDDRMVLPVARYAYPVIIPTMLLLMAGWQHLFGRPAWRAQPRAWVAAAPWFFLGAIALASIAVIYRFFRQV